MVSLHTHLHTHTRTALADMQDVILMSSSRVELPQDESTKLKLSIRQLPKNWDYKSLLKEINTDMRQHHIVIHATLSTTKEFMDQALDVGMVTDAYHYILTNLDVYTMDMSMYRTQVGGVCVCVWVGGCRLMYVLEMQCYDTPTCGHEVECDGELDIEIEDIPGQ